MVFFLFSKNTVHTFISQNSVGNEFKKKNNTHNLYTIARNKGTKKGLRLALTGCFVCLYFDLKRYLQAGGGVIYSSNINFKKQEPPTWAATSEFDVYARSTLCISNTVLDKKRNVCGSLNNFNDFSTSKIFIFKSFFTSIFVSLRHVFNNVDTNLYH